jgi:hypothetical protein
VGDYGHTLAAPIPAALVVSDMVPMDLDVLRVDIIEAMRTERSSRGGQLRGRGRGRVYWDRKYWNSRGTGHLRRECPSKKKEGSGKGNTW